MRVETVAVHVTRAPLRGRSRPNGHDEIAEALDYLAHALATTGNRRLLPIYERLERELAVVADGDAVMRRAQSRARRARRARRGR